MLYGWSNLLPVYLQDNEGGTSMADRVRLYFLQRKSLIGRTAIASYITSMYIFRQVLKFTEYIKLSPLRFVMFLLTISFVLLGPYFTFNILMGVAKGESQGLFKGFTNIISGFVILLCFSQALRNTEDTEKRPRLFFAQLMFLLMDVCVFWPIVLILSLCIGWLMSLDFLLMFIMPTAGLFYKHENVFNIMNESKIFIGGVFAFLCLGLARQFLNSSIVSGMSALFFMMVLYYILIGIRDFFKSLLKKD
tara:strand:- start:2712 stop:3458 length:747 start_codon:yes stop_codon:yes gene_type:complete